MTDSVEMSAALEEQRRLIEQQHVVIQRQRRQMEAQLRLVAVIQAELDALRVIVRRVAPLESPTHGNGSGSHLRQGTMASTDQT
jgi:hypothetical protein